MVWTYKWQVSSFFWGALKCTAFTPANASRWSLPWGLKVWNSFQTSFRGNAIKEKRSDFKNVQAFLKKSSKILRFNFKSSLAIISSSDCLKVTSVKCFFQSLITNSYTWPVFQLSKHPHFCSKLYWEVTVSFTKIFCAFQRFSTSFRKISSNLDGFDSTDDKV